MSKENASPDFEISQLVGEESPASLSEILTRAPKKGWKPKISHLPDAIVDGKFIVQEGERVIIEYTQELSRDTAIWTVSKIFEVVPDDLFLRPGHIRLWDPEKTQYGCTNYRDAEKYGLVMKIPDKSRRWTPDEEENMMQLAKRHRRKRKKKNVVADDLPKAKTEKTSIDIPTKKKRGRPKGSKNKSTLEREAREAAAKRSAA